MLKSFEGLSGLIRDHLGRNPLNGEVFLFLCKHRDKIKLFRWQGISFTLYYKRLEKETFGLPNYSIKSGSMKFSYTQMVIIVEWINH